MCFRVLILLSLVFNVYKCSYKDDNELSMINLNCIFQDFESDPYGCKASHLSVSSRKTTIQKVIHGIGDYFPNLQRFIITKSRLRHIEWRDFRNMKNLKVLSLNENKIERISQCAFQYLENLESISLDGNQIKALNERHFMNLPNLVTVSANDNSITELETDLFQNNLKLKDILFRNNQLKAIRINFRQLRSLGMVDLQSNKCISIKFECCDYFSEFIGNITQKCEGPGICN
ncbi:unnamed protein product [Chironomus riparius]|uniref:Uncharacterized protein n=1 Tax=Chironomus riparius TaxID=315576 RepID=A0A9P0ISA4_9DIPT|nr:unnamed protein product [Chironomus riparius]